MSPFALLNQTLLRLPALIGDDNKGFQRSFKSAEEKHKYRHRFNGELYPKEISRRMLTTGSLIVVDAVAALYWECYLLGFLAWICLICSINFWRKPMRGLRRDIDMVVAVSTVSTHVIYGVMHSDRQTGTAYVLMVAVDFVFYLLSKWSSHNGYLHLDSLFHCSMHCWGHLWNCWMYHQVYLQRTPQMLTH